MVYAPVRYYKNGAYGNLYAWESRIFEGYRDGGTPLMSINIREREIVIRTDSSSIDYYLEIPTEIDLQQPHHYLFQYITTNSRTLLQVFIDGEYIADIIKLIPQLDEFVIGRQNNTQAGINGDQYRYNRYGEEVEYGTIVEEFLIKDVSLQFLNGFPSELEHIPNVDGSYKEAVKQKEYYNYLIYNQKLVASVNGALECTNLVCDIFTANNLSLLNANNETNTIRIDQTTSRRKLLVDNEEIELPWEKVIDKPDYTTSNAVK